MSARHHQAFTLVEILVVFVIISLLIGLAIPSLRDIEGSARLTDSADRIVRIFRLARQHATTENRRIEVRFYRFADPDSPRSEVAYRAVMLTAPDENGGGEQLSGLFRFPAGLALAGDTNLSSVLRLGKEGIDNRFPVEEVRPTPFVGVTFRANGTIDGPPSEKYFVTLWSEREAKIQTPPRDYITIQVDPVSGGIETFRP